MTRQLLGIPFDAWQVFSAKNTTRYGIAVRLLTSEWVISFFATIWRRFGTFRAIWDELRWVWGDLETYDAIRVDLRWFRTELGWVLDHLRHKRRSCDELNWLEAKIREFRIIAAQFSLIGVDLDEWVTNLRGSKRNTIHYGVAFYTNLGIFED